MRLPPCSLPTLLAIVCASGTLPAVTIKDDGLTVALKGQIQARASIGAGGTFESSSPTAPNSYDPLRGSTGEADLFRFDFRRVRVGIDAQYGDGWYGTITLASEKNDLTESGKNSRAVNLYYAYLGKTFKDEDISHSIRGGLDKIFNNDSIISSSSALFPNDRPTQALTSYRNLGLGYRFQSPIVNFGTNVANNSSGSKPKGAGENTVSDAGNSRNGFLVSGRVEFSPSKALMIEPDKRKESYLGKEGTQVVFGLEIQVERNRLEDGAASGIAATNPLAPGTPLAGTNPYVVSNNTVWGPDALFHWNALTLLGELRAGKTTRTQYNDNGAEAAVEPVPFLYWSVQAGYAFPIPGGLVLEPAIRFSFVDQNRDLDNNSNYFSGYDYADMNYKDGGKLQDISGKQVEIGLNLYEKGTTCKTQLEYLNWRGENGNGSAHMFILQQQIAF